MKNQGRSSKGWRDWRAQGGGRDWEREAPGQAHRRVGGRLAVILSRQSTRAGESGSGSVWITGPPPSLGFTEKKARVWVVREEEHQEAWGGGEKTLGSWSKGTAGALSALDLIDESGPRPGQVSWRQVSCPGLGSYSKKCVCDLTPGSLSAPLREAWKGSQ